MEISKNQADMTVRTELRRADLWAKADYYKQLENEIDKVAIARVLPRYDKTTCQKCKDLASKGYDYTMDDIKRVLPAHPRCNCTFDVIWKEKKN
ncbi:hypothetical protein J2127_000514 [Methanococcus voltae]|uniref:hypothetical protein n=1 Tax=Methanococcus voltae TaxID=2188 RepID=UPI001AE9736B|nr:hypothetical protein [Methanococcus voltae]MBP2143359.1 hypothetical protein [Methanococcus voltae]